MCALSLAAASTSAWSDTGAPRYEMAFFSDSHQGSKIENGKYQQAIEKISTKAGSGIALHAKTNLCVAYTKSGDIEAARIACEEAVVAAKTFRKVPRSDHAMETPAQMRARYLAIALSNRGVLRAVTGDFDAARADFDAALAQEARFSSVRANIEKLEVAATTA
jgi:Tfp pilus assembly protein PilF